MKKIILSLILLMTPFLSTVFSQNNLSPVYVKKIGLSEFSRLIIRGDITVMLIEDDTEDTARIEGSEKFIEKVIILQAHKELVVRTKSFKDLKKSGIVYIPVHSLQSVEINADAKVISYNTLHSPELNILINGNCTVDLVLKGKLNIREAEGYDFTYNRVYENKKTPFVQNKNLHY